MAKLVITRWYGLMIYRDLPIDMVWNPLFHDLNWWITRGYINVFGLYEVICHVLSRLPCNYIHVFDFENAQLDTNAACFLVDTTVFVGDWTQVLCDTRL